MAYKEIRELLDRYWEGTSSLEEERRLRDFFRSATGALPEDLEEVAPLFAYFGEEAEHVPAPALRLPWRRGRFLRLLAGAWEYAALVLIVAGAALWTLRPATPQPPAQAIEDTYQNPIEAFKTTQKALALMGAQLNLGKEQMAKLALFYEAQEKVSGNTNN